MKENLLKRFKQFWPVPLFLVFTVFLYGPLSLYLPNSQELWFHIGLVLKIIIPVSLVIWLVLTVIAVFLPDKVGRVYRNLLFGITLGLYIQGNYINISYGSGVMDGTAVDWSQYTGYAIIDTVVMLICLALPWIVDILFAKVQKLKDMESLNAAKVIAYASLFFTVIQVPALISQAVSYVPSSQGEFEITSDGIYDLAEQDNIIFIVVDTLDESFYETFLENNPEYADNLGGFTHYSNTLTAGGRTMLAIPAMLTGTPFKRQKTYTDYLASVWNEPNVLSALSDQGYDVRVYSETTYFDGAVADSVENFVSDTSTTDVSLKILGEKLYKMTLYKFVPHLLKRFFTMATSEFEAARVTVANESGSALYKIDDVAFYDGFEEAGFTVNSDYKGTFRLYHLHGAHSPYTMGSDGNAMADATVDDQVAGNFYCINEMLTELKAEGLYDSATIVISADHGENGKAQWPALLVKEAGKTENDAYVESAAPASLFDLPILFTEAAGTSLNGQTYGKRLQDLTESTSRERHYFHNTTNSSQVVVNEYVATGLISDDNSCLKLVNSYEDPNGGDTLYDIGTELSFGTDATANRYVTDGFATNTGFNTHLRGPIATMTIPLSSMPEADTLHVHIGQASYSVGCHIKIQVNGTDVFEDTLDKDEASAGIDFDMPASLIDDEDPKLEFTFLFPEVDESEMELNVRQRTEVAAFTDMKIEEVK